MLDILILLLLVAGGYFAYKAIKGEPIWPIKKSYY
jgi:hypothetical protein